MNEIIAKRMVKRQQMRWTNIQSRASWTSAFTFSTAPWKTLFATGIKASARLLRRLPLHERPTTLHALAEKWKWTEIRANFDWQQRQAFNQIQPQPLSSTRAVRLVGRSVRTSQIPIPMGRRRIILIAAALSRCFILRREDAVFALRYWPQ